jgi:hypothetical protein
MGRRQSHGLLYLLIGAGSLVIVGLLAAIIVVLMQDRNGESEGGEMARRGESETEAPPAEPVDQPAAGETAAATEGTGVASAPAVEQPPTEPVVPVVNAQHMLAANSAATLVGAGVGDRAEGLAEVMHQAEIEAQAVAARESSRRDRDRDRDRHRSSRDDEEEEERRASRDRDRDEDRDRDRDEDRERDRSSRDDEEADPVSSALANIRRRDDDEESSSESREETRDRDEEEAAEEAEEASASSDRDDSLPETLSQSQVSRTVRRYRRPLADCRRLADLPAGEVWIVRVDLTIHGSGSVARASADSSGEAEDCVIGVFRDMEFPEFSGDSMQFTYPLRLR